MRTLNTLLILVVLLTLLDIKNSSGEIYYEYEVFADSDFSHPHDVCIDPGHGGPTALKYKNNGDGHGSYGYQDSLSEQWINLQVAYELRDSLLYGICPFQFVQGVIMTREGWRDIPAPNEGGYWRRIIWSRYANMGGPVNEFISIHHNGFPNPADQGTESFWCNWTTTPDSGFPRDTTSKLARKVRMKIHDIFNTDAECSECYEDRDTRLKCDDNFVLPRVMSTQVLTEASDITWHPDEEDAFEDSNSWHTSVEAGGIIRGWCSYKNNSGFVTIRNSAITGNDGFLWTDWEQWGQIQWDSPYYTVWEEGEQGWIDFPFPYQYIGGVQVYFHHIEELEHGYYSTNNSLFYVVPQCSTHTIVAYWTGGPYSAQLYSPNGGQHWRTCQEKNITWNASVGADSTTRINIYISRDGGNNFDLISADSPNTGPYTWTVSGLASEQCKIKVIAHDTAGNQASDVSDENFTIQGHSVTVTSPDGYETWHVGEQETTTWSSAYLCTTSHVDIYLSRDGGGNFDPIVSDLFNIGFYVWTVTGDYSNHCRIKVVVDDVVGNSASDSSNNDFAITAPGNDNPMIDERLHCKYPYDECNECIKYGESFTLGVNAHDPDADSIYYEWYAMWGHFPNGQDTMTTAENYVVYTAPAKAKEGAEKQWEDFLKCTVVDVRGGSNFTSGYLGLYYPETSCICGDANGNSVVDLSDVMYILSYLYLGGTPPPEPIERADPNNDCVVANSADATYILAWLFYGGPPPVCCWIRPPEELSESF